MKQAKLAACAVTAVPFPEWNPSYGDVMTMEAFIGAAKSGAFIDDDGMGEYSDGMFVSRLPYHDEWLDCDDLIPTHLPEPPDEFVMPSDIRKGIAVVPAWATHVVWYNR